MNPQENIFKSHPFIQVLNFPLLKYLKNYLEKRSKTPRPSILGKSFEIPFLSFPFSFGPDKIFKQNYLEKSLKDSTFIEVLSLSYQTLQISHIRRSFLIVRKHCIFVNVNVVIESLKNIIKIQDQNDPYIFRITYKNSFLQQSLNPQENIFKNHPFILVLNFFPVKIFKKLLRKMFKDSSSFNPYKKFSNYICILFCLRS